MLPPSLIIILAAVAAGISFWLVAVTIKLIERSDRIKELMSELRTAQQNLGAAEAVAANWKTRCANFENTVRQLQAQRSSDANTIQQLRERGGEFKRQRDEAIQTKNTWMKRFEEVVHDRADLSLRVEELEETDAAVKDAMSSVIAAVWNRELEPKEQAEEDWAHCCGIGER